MESLQLKAELQVEFQIINIVYDKMKAQLNYCRLDI